MMVDVQNVVGGEMRSFLAPTDEIFGESTAKQKKRKKKQGG
jgi:hypothetical protein